LQSIDFLPLVDTEVKTISLEKSLENVIEYLSTSNMPIIPVLDERNKLLGIVDFEVIRPIVFNPYRIKFTEVKEVMIQPKEIINHDDGMETIMEKFETTNETLLPVTKNGKFFGLIAKVDLLEAYREKLKEMIIE
jgi:CIC family chloride channel protein